MITALKEVGRNVGPSRKFILPIFQAWNSREEEDPQILPVGKIEQADYTLETPLQNSERRFSSFEEDEDGDEGNGIERQPKRFASISEADLTITPKGIHGIKEHQLPQFVPSEFDKERFRNRNRRPDLPLRSRPHPSAPPAYHRYSSNSYHVKQTPYSYAMELVRQPKTTTRSNAARSKPIEEPQRPQEPEEPPKIDQEGEKSEGGIRAESTTASPRVTTTLAPSTTLEDELEFLAEIPNYSKIPGKPRVPAQPFKRHILTHHHGTAHHYNPHYYAHFPISQQGPHVDARLIKELPPLFDPTKAPPQETYRIQDQHDVQHVYYPKIKPGAAAKKKLKSTKPPAIKFLGPSTTAKAYIKPDLDFKYISRTHNTPPKTYHPPLVATTSTTTPLPTHLPHILQQATKITTHRPQYKRLQTPQVVRNIYAPAHPPQPHASVLFHPAHPLATTTIIPVKQNTLHDLYVYEQPAYSPHIPRPEELLYNSLPLNRPAIVTIPVRTTLDWSGEKRESKPKVRKSGKKKTKTKTPYSYRIVDREVVYRKPTVPPTVKSIRLGGKRELSEAELQRQKDEIRRENELPERQKKHKSTPSDESGKKRPLMEPTLLPPVKKRDPLDSLLGPRPPRHEHEMRELPPKEIVPRKPRPFVTKSPTTSRPQSKSKAIKRPSTRPTKPPAELKSKLKTKPVFDTFGYWVPSARNPFEVAKSSQESNSASGGNRREDRRAGLERIQQLRSFRSMEAEEEDEYEYYYDEEPLYQSANFV